MHENKDCYIGRANTLSLASRLILRVQKIVIIFFLLSFDYSERVQILANFSLHVFICQRHKCMEKIGREKRFFIEISGFWHLARRNFVIMKNLRGINNTRVARSKSTSQKNISYNMYVACVQNGSFKRKREWEMRKPRSPRGGILILIHERV